MESVWSLQRSRETKHLLGAPPRPPRPPRPPSRIAVVPNNGNDIVGASLGDSMDDDDDDDDDDDEDDGFEDELFDGLEE